MNRLESSKLLENEKNYYSLIIAISKIARKIVEEENQLRNICPDNPVEDAVREFVNGKYSFE